MYRYDMYNLFRRYILFYFTRHIANLNIYARSFQKNSICMRLLDSIVINVLDIIVKNV